MEGEVVQDVKWPCPYAACRAVQCPASQQGHSQKEGAETQPLNAGLSQVMFNLTNCNLRAATYMPTIEPDYCWCLLKNSQAMNSFLTWQDNIRGASIACHLLCCWRKQQQGYLCSMTRANGKATAGVAFRYMSNTSFTRMAPHTCPALSPWDPPAPPHPCLPLSRFHSSSVSST